MTAYGNITWRKARRSGQNGSCVEVRSHGTAVLIRDSKYLRDPNNDPAVQPIIEITVRQWHTFLDAIAKKCVGQTEPAIDIRPDGSATLTAQDGTTLDYTPAEWEAFSLGVLDGEFSDLLNKPLGLELSAV